jgi:hypothetical protein
MTLYRFHYAGAAITYAARPQHALTWAARFARWSGRELLRIEEIRPLTHQLRLT